MLEPRLGVRTFFLPDHGNRFAVEPRQPANDGGVLGELAVAGKGREISEHAGDIVEAMRTVGMAGDLRLLPRRQFLVQILEGVLCAFLQPGDFIAHIDCSSAILAFFQLKDFAFQIGNRLFEVEIIIHEKWCFPDCRRQNRLFKARGSS